MYCFTLDTQSRLSLMQDFHFYADCRICVWNAVDGSLVHSLTGHTDSVSYAVNSSHNNNIYAYFVVVWLQQASELLMSYSVLFTSFSFYIDFNVIVLYYWAFYGYLMWILFLFLDLCTGCAPIQSSNSNECRIWWENNIMGCEFEIYICSCNLFTQSSFYQLLTPQLMLLLPYICRYGKVHQFAHMKLAHSS